ncbi:hypothetical protein [Natrialba sp. SSL1]|uniref:hypothetical protein n=1 Tax=Natrialba sp. SSL1 TaxID=1869245 RepID=UPI0011143BE9|nr:hypothetical protein [Natrialba sp. SSL1]
MVAIGIGAPAFLIGQSAISGYAINEIYGKSLVGAITLGVGIFTLGIVGVFTFDSIVTPLVAQIILLLFYLLWKRVSGAGA